MSSIDTDGAKIHGAAATAAAAAATDFAIYQQMLRGADLASASSLPAQGIENYFHVTGTNNISWVTIAGMLDGKEFHLRFASSLILGNNTASPPGGTVPMFLLSGANTLVAPGSIAGFRYDAGLGAMVQIFGVGPSSAVASVSAGPGISITGTGTNPIVNNTGVLSVTAGTGISITGTGANPIVNNTGVLSLTAGPGISVTGTSQNPIVNNTGVLSISAGVGISITGTANSPVVTNTGVIAIAPAQGIIVQGTAQVPVLAAKVIGCISLGGRNSLPGSTRVWMLHGESGSYADPYELPIDAFIAAGATGMKISGFVSSYVSAGGATPFQFTVKGALISGTSFSISAGGVLFGTGVIGIPSDPGGPGPMRIGLSAIPNGSGGLVVCMATITFS